MESTLKQVVPPNTEPSPTEPSEGSLIAGRFTVEALAGRGGMGTIYRARDAHSGRRVALKLLQPSPGPQALQRFTREASLLADLHHPGIVSHVAHGLTEQGQPFLAMEWLEGEDLAHRLAHQPLSVSETLALVRRAAQALTVVHQQGILHRDLKPSNLFLRAGNPEDVVLLDFGLARHMLPSHGVTGSHAVIGTPGYMAPEQASGEESLTPAVDLFSLGCVLYECLVGRAPFSAPHFAAVLAKILFAQPPLLRTLRPELPDSLQALMDLLLAKDARERLADAGALVLLLPEPGARLEDLRLEPAASQPPALLADAEQQLVSVLLASPRARASPDSTLMLAPRGVLRDSLRDLLASHGGRTELLADGSLVTTLAPKRGTATDQAALAARCALLIKESWPEALVVLTTGRGTLQMHLPVGEAMERAGELLRQHEQWPDSSRLVVLDETTAGLLGSSFQLSRPQSGTFLLHGQQAGSDDSRPLLGRPTPCVGREQELTLLEFIFTSCAEEPAARAVLITAPAGVGKSRLRHELLRRLERRSPQALVLLGRGDPMSAGSAEGLLGQALRRLCGILDGEPLEVRRAKLGQRLARHVPAVQAQDVIEFLSELCGLPFPDEASPRLRAARTDPRLMGAQVNRALVTFLRAECARGPVLLVLEDLHWSDALTIKHVDEALRELAEQPLMVLALARPEAKQLFPGLWSRCLQELSLRGLSKTACARLAQEVLGPQLSESTSQRIVEQAAGNALFLEELIRLVAEGREHSLPESVLAMLQSRILRLEPGARQVLLAGSVFGRSFWAGGVAALLPPRTPSHELPLDLRQLVELEIIEPQPTSRFPSETEYRFRHALVRDAAYGLVPEGLKPGCHRLAAQWLEQVGETDPRVLAEHYQLGVQLERAVDFYALAAEQFLERHDLHGTLRQVEAAQACGARGAVQVRLRTLQAMADFWLGNFIDSSRLGRAVLPELEVGSKAWCGLMACLIAGGGMSGEHRESAQLSQLLLGTTPHPDATSFYAEAIAFQAAAASWVGDRQTAMLFLERLTQVNTELMARDAIAQGWTGFAHCFVDLFEPQPWQALQWAEQGARFFLDVGSENNAIAPLIIKGLALMVLGDVNSSVAHLRDVLRRARQAGQQMLISPASCYLAQVLARYPQEASWTQEARALALEYLASGQDVICMGLAHDALARLAAHERDWAEAEAQARKARELVVPFRPFLISAHTTLSTILLAQGRSAESREVATLGVGILGSINSRGMNAVAMHLALAEACLALGDSPAANTALQQALRCLRERLRDIPDLAYRERFLSAVRENARTVELAREHLGVVVQASASDT